jgi:hypothetical protein
MKQVNFDRFVDAYRDACRAPLDDTALKRRINRTLRERAATNRQRPWLWLFGLGGMLTASLASATPAGQHVISWLQRQLPSLEHHYAAPAPDESVASNRHKPRVEAPAKHSIVDRVPEPEIEGADLAEVPASLSEGSNTKPAVDVTGLNSARRNTRQAAATVATPVTGAGNATSLYERAFQLQFTQSNYRAALVAWDSYLAVANGGALVGEARFNRAVCLVALGRYGEARAALTKIANGAGGAAYQARAHTLLQALENAAQR